MEKNSECKRRGKVSHEKFRNIFNKQRNLHDLSKDTVYKFHSCEYLQRKALGEFPGRCTRGCDVADYDLSIGFDAGENGGNPEGRVQVSAAGILANV